MKKLILFFLCILFIKSYAQNELKVKSASINFAIKNAGINVNGKFTGFEAQINFNPADISSAKIEAKIDVNSINTGINARDKHLKKEEYFDVEKYSKIAFTLIEIIEGKDNIFNATGELVIKNTKKKVTLPFSYINKTFKGNFTINRKDFGVGGNSWIMSDKVLISFEVFVE